MRNSRPLLRRLGTLYAVGQAVAAELDRERVLQTITDAARDLSGAQFGAFFYNVSDSERGHYLLYTLSGAARAAFERFGEPRNTAVFAPTFAGEGVVRVADIRKDPRYGHNRPHHGTPVGHLPVTSYLAVPVTSRTGEVFGGLFLGHPDAGVFDEEAERVVVALASQAVHRARQRPPLRSGTTGARRRRAGEPGKGYFSPCSDTNCAIHWPRLQRPQRLAVRPARAEPALDSPVIAAGQLDPARRRSSTLSRVTQGRMRSAGRRSLAPSPAAVDSARGVRPARHALNSRCPDEAAPGRRRRRAARAGGRQPAYNAAKYTDRGGRITLEASGSGESAVLRVAGHRRRHPARMLPRIFDLFVQAERSLDRSQRRARHRPDAGARRWSRCTAAASRRAATGRAGAASSSSRLPARAPAPAARRSGPAAVPAASGPPRPRGRRQRGRRREPDAAPRLLGHEVRVADDGAVALAAARSPAARTSCCSTSACRAWTATRWRARLRERPGFAGSTLVALTGYGQEEDRRAGPRAAGFDHHLVKPVEVDHIQRLMAEPSTANAAVS